MVFGFFSVLLFVFDDAVAEGFMSSALCFSSVRAILSALLFVCGKMNPIVCLKGLTALNLNYHADAGGGGILACHYTA